MNPESRGTEDTRIEHHDDRESVPRPWPPREGLRFFLAWMAGLVGFRLASVGLWKIGSTAVAPNLVMICALFGWQSWLLFQKWPQRLAWGTLSLVVISAPSLVSRQWIEYSIIAGAIQSLVLLGARNRCWLWCAVVLVQIGLDFAYPAKIFLAWARQLQPWIPTAGGLDVLMGMYFGWVLLGEMLGAAVLAWWMPPIEKREGSS
jgi:hypothetical protein